MKYGLIKSDGGTGPMKSQQPLTKVKMVLNPEGVCLRDENF